MAETALSTASAPMAYAARATRPEQWPRLPRGADPVSRLARLRGDGRANRW